MSVRSLLLALPVAAVAVSAASTVPDAIHGVQPQNMDLAVKPGDDFTPWCDSP